MTINGTEQTAEDILKLALAGHKPKHPCTDCGSDAYIGMSNVIGPQGQIIGADERLCMKCTKKRGGFNPFARK